MLFYLFRPSIPLQVIDRLFTKNRYTYKKCQKSFTSYYQGFYHALRVGKSE